MKRQHAREESFTCGDGDFSELAAWQSLQVKMAREGSLITVVMKAERTLYAEQIAWKNCSNTQFEETN